MTPLQLATLGVRLVGLIWAVVAISNSYPWIAYVADARPGEINTPWFVLLAALQLLTCAALLLFPATIATMLLPSLRSTKAPAPSQPFEWQTLGIVCVGLWVLSRAVPDAFYWATYYFAAGRSGLDDFASDPQHLAGIVATIVEVTVGLWLTLGGKGIAAILLAVRTAGLRK